MLVSNFSEFEKIILNLEELGGKLSNLLLINDPLSLDARSDLLLKALGPLNFSDCC